MLVQLEDGLWCEGRLTSYRKVEGVWSGRVAYSPAPGDDRSGWFEEGRIRGATVLDVLGGRVDNPERTAGHDPGHAPSHDPGQDPAAG